MDTKLIQHTIKSSLNSTMTFPEVVGHLMTAGIDYYHVDLVRGENRYYTASGASHVETVPFEHPTAAPNFSAEKVAAAVKSIQAGLLNYQQFLERILEAGTVFYMACLTGRQVIYFGRKGDFHAERFPQAK